MLKIAKYLLVGRDIGDDANILMKGFVKKKEALREYEKSNAENKSLWQLVKKEEK